MTEPLIFIPGVSSDERVWAGMPPADVVLPAADSIEGMADEVLAGAPPTFALAGYSMGGYVALAVALKAPQRVTRLALISTSAAADDEQQRAGRRSTMAAAQSDFEAVAERLGDVLVGGPAKAGPLPAKLEAMILELGLETFLRHQKACLGRADRRGELRRLTMPTLVLNGAEDKIVAPAQSDILAAGIAGARRVVLADCGHAPMREFPDETREALDAWLRS